MTRERTPRPGVTWDREQRFKQVEQVVSPEDGGESPFGWREPAKALPAPNRAARRALDREAEQQRQARQALCRCGHRRGAHWFDTDACWVGCNTDDPCTCTAYQAAA